MFGLFVRFSCKVVAAADLVATRGITPRNWGHMWLGSWTRLVAPSATPGEHAP